MTTLQDEMWDVLSDIIEDPANVLLTEQRAKAMDLLRRCQEAQSAAEDLETWAVVQEGGSSCEFYLHLLDSEEEAIDDRISCTADGAYRTSEPFKVDPNVMKVDEALRPYVFQFVDECMQATHGVSCVDVPDDYEPEA